MVLLRLCAGEGETLTDEIMPPGSVTQLRANVDSTGAVHLAWRPPANVEVPVARYYVLRFRLESGGSKWDATCFLSKFVLEHLDPDLPAGDYRYHVGALNLGGSGKAATVDIAVPVVTKLTQGCEKEWTPASGGGVCRLKG